jgi:transcriptional regulator GlxA family with amidase domain
MLTRARRVAVLLFDEVDLLDVAGPLEVFSRAGRRWNFRPFKVELVAEHIGSISTRGQLRVEATCELARADPAEIVLVPGGYGARRFAEDAENVRALRRLANGAEIVAGIGAGLFPLARAGFLSGARVAIERDASAALLEIEPNVSTDMDARSLESERIFSARSSGAAIELALGIVRATLGAKLFGMVAAELGIETPQTGERVEIRY